MSLLEQVDWVKLIDTGTQHYVLPLLYWTLNRDYSEHVPVPVLWFLKNCFLENVDAANALANEMVAIVNTLKIEGIDAVPFKGPALSVTVYGNIALRQIGDLDILIRKRDRLLARRVLESRSYRLKTPIDDGGAPKEIGKFEYQFEQTGGITAELRWRVTQRQFASSLDLDFIWNRCEPTILAGAEVPGIAPEDLLLILCVHGAKHCWSRLMWICDVAELIRAFPQLDWKQTHRRASRLGIWRVTSLGLLLAESLLDAAVPEVLLAEARRDTTTVRLRDVILGEMFHPSAEFPESQYHILILERRRDRFWQTARSLPRWVLPNERDRDFLSLPSSLQLAYFLIRPFRLVYEYVWAPQRSQKLRNDSRSHPTPESDDSES